MTPQERETTYALAQKAELEGRHSEAVQISHAIRGGSSLYSIMFHSPQPFASHWRWVQNIFDPAGAGFRIVLSFSSGVEE